MIARSEEEFEKFQQMDIQRRREEASLGADRKPRLMEESELPPFLLQDDELIDEEEEPEKIELGRGNRARKETNYDDQLSERAWLKAIGVSLLSCLKKKYAQNMVLCSKCSIWNG